MEHIKHIEIRNFKSIKHCVIDGCKRINVFVGAPNVGKSNILEAMSLLGLYESISRSNNLDDYLRYETISSLYYDKNIENPFLIKIDKKNGVSGVVKKGRDSNYFYLNHYNNLDQKYHLEFYSIGFKLDSKFFPVKNKINAEGRKAAMATTYGYNNVEKLELKSLLKYSNVKKYHYKEDLRFVDYNTNELYIPTGENLGTFLAFQNGNLIKAIQKLVEPNNFEIESNGNIRYKKSSKDGLVISFNFNEIADTLKRLIFHLTAIMSNKDSILLLEEPEAQMYPPYISKLTGEIIADDNNNQFFIATHNPYVLNDLMEDAKEDLAIYLVYEKEGETKVQRLNEQEMHDAYQYGSAFFMNIPNFIRE